MKVLLIVDIQKSMGHWFSWSYINKVYSFLKQNKENYDAIYMLMEANLNVGEEKLKNLNEASKEQIAEILNSMTYDEVPEFFSSYLLIKPIYKMYNQQLFSRAVELGLLPSSNFIMLPPNGYLRPYDMYINPDFSMLLYHLKRASQVDIIGGGLDKCAALTDRLLTHLGIKTNVIRSLCYDIRIINSNRRERNVFDTKPIKSLSKDLLDDNGHFRMRKIPFVF